MKKYGLNESHSTVRVLVTVAQRLEQPRQRLHVLVGAPAHGRDAQGADPVGADRRRSVGCGPGACPAQGPFETIAQEGHHRFGREPPLAAGHADRDVRTEQGLFHRGCLLRGPHDDRGVAPRLGPVGGDQIGQPHTTIAGAGHFVQEQQGERLGRIVAEFIATS